jgi:hypothetical protein
MKFLDRFGRSSLERSQVDRLASYYDGLDGSRPIELHRETAEQEIDFYVDKRTKGWKFYAEPPGPDESGRIPLYELGLIDSRSSHLYEEFDDGT